MIFKSIHWVIYNEIYIAQKRAFLSTKSPLFGFRYHIKNDSNIDVLTKI